MHKTHQEGAALRRGFYVFGALVVIEIAEYALGVGIKHRAWLVLAPLALVGAWPIVWYFMHLPQLWRHEEE